MLVLKADNIPLNELIGGNKKTFNIPVYQRNYDWKIEQCNQLFNDIERILGENFAYRHFLGTIVYVQGYAMPNFIELIIIDGQQRITTIMLLMKALYDVMVDEDKKADILEDYLINVRAEEKYRIKLKPIETDRLVYKNLLEGEEVTCDSNITKNYEFFKEKIAQSQYTPEQIYKAVGHIDIVYISLDKDRPSENPQMIFESLNSTGLSLVPSDLVRNFLLMRHDYNKQIELYEKYWLKIENNIPNSQISDFVRDYLTMKTGIIPVQNKVYVRFKEYCAKSKASEEAVLKELKIYAQYYKWLLEAKTPVEAYNEFLADINDMRSSVVYPLLLYLFEKKFNSNEIKEEELAKVLQLLVSFMFRRIICNYATNALSRLYSTLTKEIEEKLTDKNDCYNFIAKALCSKANSRTFPQDAEFKNSFIMKDIVKPQNIRERNILLKFEKYLSKETINPENIQLEHIMPQTLSPQWQVQLGNKAQEVHDTYLHTIGNLTLTGYNATLSNDDFAKKKQIYKDSNITICRQLAEYSEWNADSIRKRAEWLFSIAVNIWQFPQGFSKISEELDYDLEIDLFDNLDVTGEKPLNLTIGQERYMVQSWKEFLLILCRKLYDFDKELFRFLIDNTDFKGRERSFLSRDGLDLRNPEKIAEGLFVETNLSANSILNYSKILREKFVLFEDEISYKLKKRKVEG